jgi:hypothetical protein
LSTKICLAANTLTYPQGGGHRWPYLNLALGLGGLGCEVIWLEAVDPNLDPAERQAFVAALQKHLRPYGLAKSIALFSSSEQPLEFAPGEGWLGLEVALDADLLLNLAYDIPAEVVNRFRRSALLDIDPGLLQIWVSQGAVTLARHDLYFTTGETVGKAGSGIPALGFAWQHVPPVVALDWWPAKSPPAHTQASFTTVTHWGDAWVEYDGESYSNTKRDGFMPFLDLPSLTSQRLELAVFIGDDAPEQRTWESHGWRISDPYLVAPTPWDYQKYIQQSKGEFSCVKPSCVRLQNAWISDRTLCYLSSGRPAIVQHTGPSKLQPDAAGLFRFRNLAEAARHLETVASDYERQCRLARALAEEHFDARKVGKRMLEMALP